MSSLKSKLAAHKQSKKVASTNTGDVSSIGDVLGVDADISELVENAKKSGEILILDVDSVIPDPNQPRKTFDQVALDELTASIEQVGQIQPIVVGEKLEDGLYPIVVGERRWRAISQSSSVHTIEAVVRQPADALSQMILQLDENAKRKHISAIDTARAMKAVVELGKSQGLKQAEVGKMLGVSKSRLSKHLALLNAPVEIGSLSVHEETQDVEALYNLTKASERSQEAVEKLIDDFRSGDLQSSLRVASMALLDELKAKDKAEQNASIDKKGSQVEETGEVETGLSVRADEAQGKPVETVKKNQDKTEVESGQLDKKANKKVLAKRSKEKVVLSLLQDDEEKNITLTLAETESLIAELCDLVNEDE